MLNDKLKHLSHSSWVKLLTNVWQRYQEKVLKNYNKEFVANFCTGGAIHAAIEHYNKTGEIDDSVGYNYIMEEVQKNNVTDIPILDKMRDQYAHAFKNYFSTNPRREAEAEFEINFKLDDLTLPIEDVNCRIDAYTDGEMIDYKGVGNFTNIYDEYKGAKKYATYVWQARLYMLAGLKSGRAVKRVIFREILKKAPKDLIKCDKTTIMKMVMAKGYGDASGTIKQLIDQYDLKPQVVKDIVIEFSDEHIAAVKDQLARVARFVEVIMNLPPDAIPLSPESI